MSDGKLAIVLLTYNRFDYARRTLESTLRNLSHDGEVHVHIADDGSPSGYTDALMVVAHEWTSLVTVSNSGHRGYGANYNLAMQTVHGLADVVLPLEDDWELVREYRTHDDVMALQYGYGCVRLGYVGFTQRLMGSFLKIPIAPVRIYLELDPASEEPHVFAGHPRLETVQWEREVGPWSEGLAPGATEFEVAHRPAARERVLWPIDEVSVHGNLFAHIGTIQSTASEEELAGVNPQAKVVA